MFKRTMVLAVLFTFVIKVGAVEKTAQATMQTATQQTIETAEKLKTPAKRIVALAPHIVESLFAIGAGESIVGTVSYADFPQQALDIPRVGGYHGMQVEKILALKPDLIIVWKSGNKMADIEQLERLKLPLAYSNTSSIDDVAQELRYFGALTGREKKAEQLALQYTQKLAELRKTYQHKSAINVFYQLWSAPLMTVNKSTWIHQLLSTCGANNVFADNSTDYPQVSIENVIVAKPDLIIMPQEKSDKPQPKIEWQKWTMIPAVKNNKFMEVDADLIHRFSQRMLIGLQDMCKKIERAR